MGREDAANNLSVLSRCMHGMSGAHGFIASPAKFCRSTTAMPVMRLENQVCWRNLDFCMVTPSRPARAGCLYCYVYFSKGLGILRQRTSGILRVRERRDMRGGASTVEVVG